MTVQRRHIPFLLLTALPALAAIEPLTLYTMSTIHVTDTERAIVASVCLAIMFFTVLLWRRHRLALPAVFVAYSVFTCWYLLRLRGTIVSGNFTTWPCLIMPFCWALSTIPASFAVLVWGESYVAKKMPPNQRLQLTGDARDGQ